jgi:MoaA/NifB/PqqE/SkfB family radical SAM enzyme
MIAQGSSLDHRRLYRLPWSPTDNIISWLEPTKNCNIHCHGCYSANVVGGHKTLSTVEHELDVFERFRQTDAVSIAGGEPLTHPGIVDIVRLVSARGLKPVINTNGYALTRKLLHDLREAGARGFTFHIDSLQKRPGYTGQTETELNDLRLRYAEMLAEEGGLSCAFNATVYGANLAQVPAILEWGREHIDIAHVLVFIAFRALTGDGRFDYFVGEERIDAGKLVYSKPTPERTDITARDIVSAIRAADPDFEPCAYLNGSEALDSFKWLMTLRVGDKKRIFGHAGPKFIELAQVTNHLRHGRYLGYVPPRVHRRARWMFALAPFDRGLRAALARDVAATLRDPLRVFRPLHLQSVMIIQPVDLLPDGRQSMCDGCPDMTVFEDELVWSCRLDEKLQFAQFMRTVPAAAQNPEEVPV